MASEWFDDLNHSNEALIDMFYDNQQDSKLEDNHMILALQVVQCFRDMWFMKDEIKRLDSHLDLPLAVVEIVEYWL